MKKILCRIALFLLPFALLLLPFLAVGVLTGEMRPLDAAVKGQRQHPDAVVGMAYNMDETAYKIENANYYQNYCEQNEIKVIAFLPPFAPSVYQKMSASGNYGYLEKVPGAVLPICAKYQVEVFDFTDGAALGVTDEWFLDGFHGNEAVYNLIMQRFLAESDVLEQGVNEKILLEMYQDRLGETGFAE